MLPASLTIVADRASLAARACGASMRGVRVLILYCVLALGLAFVPVANALNMATMAPPQESTPPCHAPAKPLQQSDGKGCHAASQCHCALSVCLPAAVSVVGRTPNPSAHPQTARCFALGQTGVPETPPPITS